MRNDELLRQIGGKIKATRKANKYTLKKLSEQTGIHLTSLWFMENGRQNLHILSLKSIADAFKMEVKDFL